MTADIPEPVVTTPPVPPVPGAVDAGAPPTVGRRRRPVLWVLRLLGRLTLQAVLLVLLLTALVLGTQTGLRVALALAADLAPGLIQVGQAEGRVLGWLRLEAVEVHLTDLDIRLGQVELDWTPLAAVTGTLPIARIAVRDLDVVTAPGTDTDASPVVLPQVELPLAIELGEVLVENLRIMQRGVETPLFVLERGILAGRLQGSELAVTALELTLPEPRLQASASGQASLTGQYPLNLRLDWDLGLPSAARLHGKGGIAGDLGRLVIEQQVTGSAQVRLDAQVTSVLDRPAWDGTLQVEGVRVLDFQADAPEVAVQGRLETHGNLDAATLTGHLDAKTPNRIDFGHLQVALDAEWKDRRLDLRTLELTESVSGARFTAKGDLDLKPTPGGFKLTGAWERLRWPLTGDPTVTAPQGRLEAAGTFDAYRYALSGAVQGPALPSARLSVDGQGDGQGTVIESLRLEVLKGLIEGRGRVAWAPALSWEAVLTANGIDPGAYDPAWPGRISGRVTSNGTLEAKGPDRSATLTAAIEGVQGTLRGYPIAAAGQVQMAAGTLRIEGLTASSGPSTARLEGLIADKLDLRLAFDSPDLASLLPGAKGSAEVKGLIQGTVKALAVDLEFTARDAGLNGQGIARLGGTLALTLGAERPFRVQLDGQDLAAGGLRWESLQVRGDGTLPRHRLSAAATGRLLSIRLEAAGGLNQGGTGPGEYRATLERLDLDSQAHGHWRLEQAMSLSLAWPRVAAGPLCLRDGQGSGGCLGFEQTGPGNWTASIDLNPLGAELIQGLLPPDLTAQGSARVKGRFQAAGPVLTGSALTEVPQGRLSLAIGRTRYEELDFSRTRLTLETGAKGLGARLDLPLQGLGQLGAALDLPGWRLDAPARPGQPLGGWVRGNLSGFQQIANLTPNLAGVTGALNLDFVLGGTLGRPGVKGQGALRGFGAEVPLFGTRIANFNLTVAAPTLGRLVIQGAGEVGGRTLRIDGDGQTTAAGLGGRLTIEGDRLKVADTSEYHVLLSPDVQVTLSPQGARIGGGIGVPEARIRPRKLPAGTITPSPDVVLVDRAGAQKPPFPVEIDLRLKLGNNVTIDAFGVRGRLTGDLRVFQTPGKELLGDGQLAILDGVYRFNPGIGLGTDLIPLLSGLGTELGAPLTITQGRLVYAGTPLGNPGILLQAQRETGGFTAAVRVVGTLRNSKLAFFSESDPGLSQAEITKYLLTGIQPGGDKGAGGQALAVGTYVAPKLYMQYESGIAGSKDGVKLRYDLSRRIEIQAETGGNQGADIFYKFER